MVLYMTKNTEVTDALQYLYFNLSEEEKERLSKMEEMRVFFDRYGIEYTETKG